MRDCGFYRSSPLSHFIADPHDSEKPGITMQTPVVTETKGNAFVLPTISPQAAPAAVKIVKKIRPEVFRGQQLVIGLSTSIFICWTPIQIYYTIQIFRDFYYPEIEQVTTVVKSLLAVADPVIITIMLKDLRVVMMRVLLCRKY